MNEQIISDLLLSHLQAIPQHITRCAIGIANKVYIIDCAQKKYVFRCSIEENAYADTIYWLEKLTALDLPIPRVLFSGKWESWSYLILNHIEGEDIGRIYVALVNMGCETDYIDYLLEESVCSEIEKTAFLFYCLLYCVDFMGERGMQFGDKRVAVSDEIVVRFNKMFDDLWKKWCMCKID